MVRLLLVLLLSAFFVATVHEVQGFAWCVGRVENVALQFWADNNVSATAVALAFGRNVLAVLQCRVDDTAFVGVHWFEFYRLASALYLLFKVCHKSKISVHRLKIHDVFITYIVS